MATPKTSTQNTNNNSFFGHVANILPKTKDKLSLIYTGKHRQAIQKHASFHSDRKTLFLKNDDVIKILMTSKYSQHLSQVCQVSKREQLRFKSCMGEQGLRSSKKPRLYRVNTEGGIDATAFFERWSFIYLRESSITYRTNMV